MGNDSKFSAKDVEMLEFRQKLFREEVDKYVSAITGEQSSILPYVRGEDGVYDEKKTWEFIDELTGYAHIYWEYQKDYERREYRKKYGSDDSIGPLGALPEDDFTEQEKEFLQSFLYCALRISEAEPWRNTGELTQTFQDLVRFSKEHYEELRELYVEEARADAYSTTLLNWGNLKGIYRPAAWLIYQTTGKYMTDMYKYRDETLRDYFGYLPKDLQGDLKRYECRPSELPQKRFRRAKVPDAAFLNGPNPDETPRKETAFMRSERKKDEEKQRIKEEFAEKEQFLNQFLKFCNYKYVTGALYFMATDEDEPLARTVDSLEEIVMGMIRLFAAARGLSKIPDDDVYFTSMALLRQANKRCQSLTGGKKDV